MKKLFNFMEKKKKEWGAYIKTTYRKNQNNKPMQEGIKQVTTAEEWVLEGNVNYGQGYYSAAIQCHDYALAIDANYKRAWYSRGVALKAQGQYEAAIECFDKTLTIDRSYAHAWNGKGCVFKERGKYETAIEYFDKALAIDANYKVAWYNKV